MTEILKSITDAMAAANPASAEELRGIMAEPEVERLQEGDEFPAICREHFTAFSSTDLAYAHALAEHGSAEFEILAWSCTSRFTVSKAHILECSRHFMGNIFRKTVEHGALAYGTWWHWVDRAADNPEEQQ